ncbi:MAG: BppU family phage baseplate upper protein [Oscillospiraceae bacterium]|nr:BppU family phage baseplate upper protein [Oscillospiraceae bacterium]
MKTTQKISMDLIRRDFMPRVTVKQGDTNSRQVELALFEGGVAWVIPAEAMVIVRYRKADGTAGLYDTLPDGTAAASASENVLTINLAPQMLTYAGTVCADVVLVQEDKRLATFNFIIHVEIAPTSGAALESQDYYKVVTLDQINAALAERVKTVNYIGPDENGNVNVDAVPVSGGTFTGPVYIGQNGALYLNGPNGMKVQLKGEQTAQGDMAVRLVQNPSRKDACLRGIAEPRQENDAANKAYVDAGDKVKSVNGLIGAVRLGALDVGALPKDGGLVEGALAVQDWLDFPIGKNLGVHIMAETGQDGSKIPTLAFYGDNSDEAVRLRNVAEPTEAGDAVSKGYLERLLSKIGNFLEGVQIGSGDTGFVIVSESNVPTAPAMALYGQNGDEPVRIQGVAAPQGNGDAANKKYVDDAVAAGQVSAGVAAINGQSGRVTLPVSGFGLCETPADTVVKEIAGLTSGFVATDGAILAVKFTQVNSASIPKLKVGNETAPIYHWRTNYNAKQGDMGSCTHLFLYYTGVWLLLNPLSDTPKKGVDYWTAEDVAQIKSYLEEAVLGGAW